MGGTIAKSKTDVHLEQGVTEYNEFLNELYYLYDLQINLLQYKNHHYLNEDLYGSY